MDLKKVLENDHSKAQTNAIAKYIEDNPTRFKALVEVYLNGTYRTTQRAAWPLSICVERNPALLKPHLKTILDFLKRDKIHDAVKRNTMRLLQLVNIPTRYEGQVVDLCFEYLQNPRVAVAIRVFSITVLCNVISDKPTLKNELKIILEDQLPYSSAAFVRRARKVLRKM